MSEIIFLASSKPYIIPDEIEDFNNRTIFERMGYFGELWVNEVDPVRWEKFVEGLFSLPYIHEISGD
ncbi:hypothetical protein [Bacillus massilinigeriensis]|uniref:hypothetical protein n=1 Tax=Bacillus mediterraneensis TaxID=1805474 RepID=UPI0008F88459|nr:hypothetical protein [Bacillus mediterraneensis]